MLFMLSSHCMVAVLVLLLLLLYYHCSEGEGVSEEKPWNHRTHCVSRHVVTLE